VSLLFFFRVALMPSLLNNKRSSIDYFKQVVHPNTCVKIFTQPQVGAFPFLPTDTPFLEFFQKWQSMAESQSVPPPTCDYFLGNQALESVSESLVQDVSPRPGPANDPQNCEKGRLWIGNAGHCSHLHYDAHHGFLCVIFGRKEVWLYEPLFNLPYIKLEKPTGNAAGVNPKFPDFNRYPEFINAKFLKCDIEPGEILLIPMYWWHFVISVKPTIAVNFWVYPHLESANSKYDKYFEITKQNITYHIHCLWETNKAGKYWLLTEENVRYFFDRTMHCKTGKSGDWEALYSKAKDMIRNVIIETVMVG